MEPVADDGAPYLLGFVWWRGGELMCLKGGGGVVELRGEGLVGGWGRQAEEGRICTCVHVNDVHCEHIWSTTRARIVLTPTSPIGRS